MLKFLSHRGRILVILILLATLLGIVLFLNTILFPFLLASFLAYVLAPLIENYKLLGALSIEDRDVADNFVQEAFGEVSLIILLQLQQLLTFISQEFLVTGLSMIVTILTQGEDDDDDLEDDYIMEEVNAHTLTFLAVINYKCRQK